MSDILKEALTKGVEMHVAGEFEYASQLYGSVIKLQPNHADANHNMGLLKSDTGNDLDALPFLQTALEADTSILQFWLSYIKTLVKLDRKDEAARILNLAKESGIEDEEFLELRRQLIEPTTVEVKGDSGHNKANPSKPNILDNLTLDKAFRLAKKKSKDGSSEEAIHIYQDILVKFPKNKKAIDGFKSLSGFEADKTNKAQDPTQQELQLLINLYNQGKLEQALDKVSKLLRQFSNSVTLYNIQGAVNAGLGFLDAAIESYGQAILIKPDYAEAYNNLGGVLIDIGRVKEAIKAYYKALEIKPDYADAYYNLGIVFKDQGKFEKAIEAYNKALEIKPDYVEAYNNLGNALKEQGKHEDAIESYKKVLAIKSDYVEAQFNMGIIFQEQGRLKEAMEAYKKVLTINPDYAEAYGNIGNALKEQGKLEEAIDAYKKVLSLQPDYAKAHSAIGATLKEQGKLEEALDACNKALSLEPDDELARAQKLYLQRYNCDWSFMFEDDLFPISSLGTKNQFVNPFGLLSLEDEPFNNLKRTKLFSNNFRNQNLFKEKVKSADHKKLRIGYISGYFNQNPVSISILKMLTLHDRYFFEIFAFGYEIKQEDGYLNLIKQNVDQFFDVSKMNDLKIAELIHESKIDILVDLHGFMKGCRPRILAHRPAPIQLNYFAYPGTMGADFHDYIIADQTIIPDTQRSNYSENIIYLPNCYMPQDNTRSISDKPISRINFGLPEAAFVFCCFNNSFKISPQEFDIWMRLLSQIDGSVLWLLKTNQWAETNLRNEAGKRGIDAERLIFADKLPVDEHLGRLKLADLFLDTFNFNAHTTASDALWAGLPIVTKMGKGFAARVAGSLLTSIELPELITTSEEEYEALALSLATYPNKLTLIKKKLAEKKNSTPLFDTETYTKNLEKAYTQAYQRYADGLPPAEFKVL